jgi:hypothetical protein
MLPSLAAASAQPYKNMAAYNQILVDDALTYSWHFPMINQY